MVDKIPQIYKSALNTFRDIKQYILSVAGKDLVQFEEHSDSYCFKHAYKVHHAHTYVLSHSWLQVLRMLLLLA